MSGDRAVMPGLLRWYPPAWRERYGEEFTAFMEDAAGGEHPSVRFRFSVARAGLVERARAAALAGDSRPPAERSRAGIAVVLWAWTVFAWAGAVFAKLAEHFGTAMPPAWSGLASGGYDAVQAAGLTGAGIIAMGVAVAAPAFVRFLRDGGWTVIRGRVIRAVVAASVAVGGGFALAAWAHHLSPSQRNGGSGAYTAAFLAWAVAVVVAMALLAAAGGAVARRLPLSGGVLAFEAALAGVLAASMVAMTAGTALWWAAVASGAPWFLHGGPHGAAASAFEPRLAVSMAVMALCALVGGYGVTRSGRAHASMAA